MVYTKKEWVNVPDPDNYTGDIPLSDLPRFDADNMNRIEDGIVNHVQSLEKGGTGATTAIDAANNLMVKSIGYGIEIKENDDLNLYTEVGNYVCTLTTTAETILNRPDGLKSAFVMTIGYPTGTTSYRYQELTENSTGIKYYRTYTVAENAWSEWVVTYNTKNKPTADDVGAISSKPIFVTGVDILSITKSGWYCGLSLLNTPEPSGDGFVCVIYSEGARMLEFTPFRSSVGRLSKYLNVFSGTTWTGWVEIFHEGNARSIISGDLLWENGSPTSSFGPQEVNYDLTNYPRIKIIYRHSTTNDKEYVCEFIGRNDWRLDLDGNGIYRYVNIRDSYISFGNGYYGAVDYEVRNEMIIPVTIIGYTWL